MKSSSISGITLLNTPIQGYSINGASYLTLSSVTIDNKAGTSQGHNTDAFDVGSSDHVEIHTATVYNQDDCVAINSGTNLYFSSTCLASAHARVVLTGSVPDMYCNGGHGLSIGSVGGRSDNTVKNVTFVDSQILNSQNGVRIKAVSGATGSISGVCIRVLRAVFFFLTLCAGL
jgi:polygalacturonase